MAKNTNQNTNGKLEKNLQLNSKDCLIQRMSTNWQKDQLLNAKTDKGPKHSFMQIVLSIYCVPSSSLGAGDIKVKTD